MLRLFFFLACISIITGAQAAASYADTSKPLVFTEGILQTRVSFPGNPMNELLSAIDFEKGDVPNQLNALQNLQTNEAYRKRVNAVMDHMTAAEQQAMGQMMMAVLMSPLYATIYFDKEKALAKAYSLNYTLESFMNTTEGTGKMVAIANNKQNAAAIKFTASSLEKAWQKESVDARHYTIQWLTVEEKVSGINCKKAIYTIKPGSSGEQQIAQKLIVWYSPAVSNRINFAHPFYLDIPYGVLKIEVHYDTRGKNRMVYEVVRFEQKKLHSTDFSMSDVQPVLDWDTDPVNASMKMLSVFMSQGRQGAGGD